MNCELLTPPARRDLQAELHTVQSALDTATARRSRIEAEIQQATSIEQLAGLHDAFSLVCTEQQEAAQRAKELSDLLAT